MIYLYTLARSGEAILALCSMQGRDALATRPCRQSEFAMDFFSALTTFSTVKPYFSKQTLPGAEAPYDDMPTKTPLSPIYLCQPSSTPASTATLAVTAGGMTESLYCRLCFSHSSPQRSEERRGGEECR